MMKNNRPIDVTEKLTGCRKFCIFVHWDHVRQWDQPTSATHPRPFPCSRKRCFNVEKARSFSRLHSSVFQPISTSQPTVLVDIWSNSVCWVIYWYSSMDYRKNIWLHNKTFFRKKVRTVLRLFRTFSKLLRCVSRNLLLFRHHGLSMRKIFSFLLGFDGFWWVVLALFFKRQSCVVFLSPSKKTSFELSACEVTTLCACRKLSRQVSSHAWLIEERNCFLDGSEVFFVRKSLSKTSETLNYFSPPKFFKENVSKLLN